MALARKLTMLDANKANKLAWIVSITLRGTILSNFRSRSSEVTRSKRSNQKFRVIDVAMHVFRSDFRIEHEKWYQHEWYRRKMISTWHFAQLFISHSCLTYIPVFSNFWKFLEFFWKFWKVFKIFKILKNVKNFEISRWQFDSSINSTYFS